MNLIFNDEMIYQALVFAAERHNQKFRKVTKLPYITHLMSVNEIVSMHTSDKNILAAALLHDILEDTDTTEQEIKNFFNLRVMELVLELTEDKSLDYEIRKAQKIANISKISEGAFLIKCADCIDNMESFEVEVTNNSIAFLRTCFNNDLRVVVSRFIDLSEAILKRCKIESLNLRLQHSRNFFLSIEV